ncbi:uncharacterized protein LY89DRAFT_724634 [Mollisia scopiformis]|uniref:Uncharacterized protein n=1 Tax=Mollisia scopiformis TaxID=149040 RepID=A0A132B9N7_MOLSC|nr:uncharacterized protein LY89DRAFT_724634 [Mollisia scopiformis]KUJ09115.1 hypothetical protein LY89DRAFT_724634 [Mollisia scopiformis]
MESTASGQSVEIFKELEEYPWDKDKEFQGGLAAILGPNPQPSQIHDLTLRAQCFYLSRKRSIPIDFNQYKEYLMSKPETSTMSASAPPPPPHNNHNMASSHLADVEIDDPKAAPYPRSFAEIVELITSGKPIPGIKEIHTTVCPELATKPILPKRRKPWEKDVPQEQIDGKIGGLFGDHRDIHISQEYPDA